MRKTTRLAIAVMVLLGSAAIVTAGDGVVQFIWSSVEGDRGTAHNRSDRIPRIEFANATPLPTPTEPHATAGKAFAQRGPVSSAPTGLQSFKGSGMTGGSGALLAPRGAGFSTPRQQADRQIRQMIRRID
jgi:hypothetical protein